MLDGDAPAAADDADEAGLVAGGVDDALGTVIVLRVVGPEDEDAMVDASLLPALPVLTVLPPVDPPADPAFAPEAWQVLGSTCLVSTCITQ